MTSERDVTKLNERRRISRLTEYRVICAALKLYIRKYYMNDDENFDDGVIAEKLLKKYKDRMDSSFLGAQRDHNGRTQYPVVQNRTGKKCN